MALSSQLLLCCFKRPLHGIPYVHKRPLLLGLYSASTYRSRLWHVHYIFLCMHPINLQDTSSPSALTATSPVSAITLQPGFTECIEQKGVPMSSKRPKDTFSLLLGLTSVQHPSACRMCSPPPKDRLASPSCSSLLVRMLTSVQHPSACHISTPPPEHHLALLPRSRS